MRNVRAVEVYDNKFFYTGELTPGEWFLTSDEWSYVAFLDADPTDPKWTEYSTFDWWVEAHQCGELIDDDAIGFWRELLDVVVDSGYMTSEEAEDKYRRWNQNN